MLAAHEDRLPLDDNRAAWDRGFRSMAQNSALIEAYNSRQPILLAQAIDPSSAASTFGSASLLAAAQHDSSVPVGQVEWGLNQGWRNTRLADNSAVARALCTARTSGQSSTNRGGVVINDAGVAVPELALLCSLSMQAFQLPIGLNVYSTPAAILEKVSTSAAQPATSMPSAFKVESATKKKAASSKTKSAKGFAKRDVKGFAKSQSSLEKQATPAAPTTLDGSLSSSAAASRDAQEGAADDPINEVRETPLHTDAQDVLAVATAGAKRWKVYARPSMDFLAAMPSTSSESTNGAGIRDVYNLGKDSDGLNAETLGTPPLIDAVLLPGDALFVPAGCPHETFAVATSTGSSNDESAVKSSDPCAVHLTFGFMTLLWGLNYDTLQRVSDAVLEASNGESDESGQEQNDSHASRVNSGVGGSLGSGSSDEFVVFRTRLEAPLPLGFVSNQPALLAEAKALNRAAACQRRRRSGQDLGAESATVDESSSVDRGESDSESVVAAASFMEYHCEQLVDVLANAYTAAGSTQIPYARRAKANAAALTEVLENIIF